MSIEEQEQEMARMLLDRHKAEKELDCWNGRVLRWHKVWAALAQNAMRTGKHLEDYPTLAEIREAQQRIPELQEDISTLTARIKDR